jgi:Uma2 family endonuclease
MLTQANSPLTFDAYLDRERRAETRSEYRGGDTLLNPNLLVEVLSPSTEGADRGEKFAGYRTLPSLTDYVLISQKRVLVEHFVRQGDRRWLLTSATQLGDVIEMPSLDARLALADVYEGVQGLLEIRVD